VTWTTDPPTEPGYYWLERPRRGEFVAVLVRVLPHPTDGILFAEPVDRALSDGPHPVSVFVVGRWAGPLVPPPG
jgi:hypothetical protein